MLTEEQFLTYDPEIKWFLRLAMRPDFRQIEQQLHDVGGCEGPIWLRGSTITRAADSGLVLGSVSSSSTPFGAIPIRCMNRRATRCKSCAWLHQGDTFQLVLAGLQGGKGVPGSVIDHPVVFATLTAPGFGAVHRMIDPNNPRDRCRPRRGGPVCEHGRDQGCKVRHVDGDPVVGSPICESCYDYPGHVLWNAHASKLWKSFTDSLYHHLARHAQVKRSEIRRAVRVEYFKAAEYQARGIIHFHALIRLDHPESPDLPAPLWASATVLASCVATAAAVASLTSESEYLGPLAHRFGPQLDVHAVTLRNTDLSPSKVAAYLAKYTSKGTEVAHGADRPIKERSEIDIGNKTDHIRTLMHTIWGLGDDDDYPEYQGLNLRMWCHDLGFRGQVATKSRRYSTTYKALRLARAQHRSDGTTWDQDVIVESSWEFGWQGYEEGVNRLAAQIADNIEDQRELRRDAINDLKWQEAQDKGYEPEQ